MSLADLAIRLEHSFNIAAGTFASKWILDMTTILLVKDAADLAQVIVRELKTAGYQTLHAADGVVAR